MECGIRQVCQGMLDYWTGFMFWLTSKIGPLMSIFCCLSSHITRLNVARPRRRRLLNEGATLRDRYTRATLTRGLSQLFASLLKHETHVTCQYSMGHRCEDAPPMRGNRLGYTDSIPGPHSVRPHEVMLSGDASVPHAWMIHSSVDMFPCRE